MLFSKNVRNMAWGISEMEVLMPEMEVLETINLLCWNGGVWLGYQSPAFWPKRDHAINYFIK